MILRTNTHFPVMKKRLSIEEIKSRILGISLELMSTEYINAHVKLEWKCCECGSIFYSNWMNISSGWGCPVCKGRKTSIRIKEMRKSRGDGITSIDMKNRLHAKGLEFIDEPEEYISNLSKKESLLCLVCGNTVKIRLQDIKSKSGYGCWDCSRPKGEKHFFWKGGILQKYPPEWNNKLRESIRNRDDRKCQYPDCHYTDIENKKLHIHHINGNKQDCREFNLISLCNAHHMKIEKTNPKNWEEYFYSITEDYEWRK